MDLKDLEYFAVIAEQGSVRKAAEALNLSQPALSKSLRRLESAAATELVRRTPKGVELNAVGHALLRYGLRLRRSRDDVMRELNDLRDGRIGQLRVGAGPAMADDILPVACGALLDSGGDPRLGVMIMGNDMLMPALRTSDIDIAVSGIPGAPPEDIRQEALYDDEFVVFAAAGHPLSRKKVALASLARERWALSRANVLSEQALRSAFSERGLPPLHCAVETNAASLRFRLVARHGLLGFTSRRRLRIEQKRLHLSEIRVSDMTWHRRIGISYRDGGYLSPLALRFIEILRKTATALGR